MSIYKLSTANYEELNENIQKLLKSGVYSSVNITIFLDANGTQVANTEIGRLENKSIKNVSKLESIIINKPSLFFYVFIFISK